MSAVSLVFCTCCGREARNSPGYARFLAMQHALICEACIDTASLWLGMQRTVDPTGVIEPVGAVATPAQEARLREIVREEIAAHAEASSAKSRELFSRVVEAGEDLRRDALFRVTQPGEQDVSLAPRGD